MRTLRAPDTARNPCGEESRQGWRESAAAGAEGESWRGRGPQAGRGSTQEGGLAAASEDPSGRPSSGKWELIRCFSPYLVQAAVTGASASHWEQRSRLRDRMVPEGVMGAAHHGTVS